MILKYALFTLLVSVVPMVFILQDIFNKYDVLKFIPEVVPSNAFEQLSNILSSGVFTFFSAQGAPTTFDKGDQLEVVFTKEKLQEFTGKNGKVMYLAILGNVFDVSKSAKYYGPGETYNAFTGRDGSRAFVTGDFTENGLIDDVDGLSFQELLSLKDWLQFYHKEYTYKGKLVGRYYNKHGKPTGYNHQLQLRLEEADKNEVDKNRYKLKFPPCNVEWTPEDGSRVWCSTRSGGVERDWVGVPRKLYEPAAETYRCACINPSDQPQVIAPETGKSRAGNLEEYADCHPKSTSCYVHN